MTEKEWNESTDPQAMLEWLRHSGKTPERKLRLFVCACCRAVWGQLSDGSRMAVTIAERRADGQATDAECAMAQGVADHWVEAADGALQLIQEQLQGLPPAEVAQLERRLSEEQARLTAAMLAHTATFEDGYWLKTSLRSSELAVVPNAAALLRDVFGNPHRQVSLAPSVLTWNGGTVLQLAQAIYDERSFEQLPVLADALEDAGCVDTDLLRHCREPGVHVRGCWAVDLLLGKK